MRYFAMLFNGEVSGCCSEDGLMDVLDEDKAEFKTMAEISKAEFVAILNDDLSPDNLKNLVTVEIIKSIKITPITP